LRRQFKAVERKWTGDGSGGIFNDPTHSLEYLNNSWYWIKLQSTGITHRARYRADGTLEPFEWVQSVDDADYLSGGCGLGGFHNSLYGNFEVAWFSVGTAGDTAPLPPGMASEADLYAHWKLDETSGTEAADSSLNTNTLTTTDVVWDDGAAQFNGTSSRADCPHHASLQVADELTLSAVIHPTAVGQSSASLIAGKGEGPTQAYGLRFESDRRIRANFRTVAATLVVYSVAVPLDEPTHVAVTWNRLASGDNVRIYLNGTESGSGRVADALRATENEGHRFCVGSPFIEADRTNRRFQGGIRNLRVYKRAAPAAEVSALATYELSDQAISLHPAIVYYLNLLRA
jgi:hypothetical protein